jgi:hypothetical protein
MYDVVWYNSLGTPHYRKLLTEDEVLAYQIAHWVFGLEVYNPEGFCIINRKFKDPFNV